MAVLLQRARVSALMRRRFVTLRPEDSLLEADRLMRMARVRALPVALGDELAGMLSHRLLLLAALADELRNAPGELPGRFLRENRVSSVMDREPRVVTPETQLAVAVARLLEREEGCLPVVDAAGPAARLVAILTESDLLRAAYGRKPASH
jgi:CBS domain-containing protein